MCQIIALKHPPPKKQLRKITEHDKQSNLFGEGVLDWTNSYRNVRLSATKINELKLDTDTDFRNQEEMDKRIVEIVR